jgi:hypothetical protein
MKRHRRPPSQKEVCLWRLKHTTWLGLEAFHSSWRGGRSLVCPFLQKTFAIKSRSSTSSKYWRRMLPGLMKITQLKWLPKFQKK